MCVRDGRAPSAGEHSLPLNACRYVPPPGVDHDTQNDSHTEAQIRLMFHPPTPPYLPLQKCVQESGTTRQQAYSTHWDASRIAVTAYTSINSRIGSPDLLPTLARLVRPQL